MHLFDGKKGILRPKDNLVFGSHTLVGGILPRSLSTPSVGFTEDLKTRLKAHNQGQSPGSLFSVA
jgi:hypothetical protein